MFKYDSAQHRVVKLMSDTLFSLAVMVTRFLPAQVMMVLSYERLVEPPVVQHASDSTESEG